MYKVRRTNQIFQGGMYLHAGDLADMLDNQAIDLRDMGRKLEKDPNQVELMVTTLQATAGSIRQLALQ